MKGLPDVSRRPVWTQEQNEGGIAMTMRKTIAILIALMMVLAALAG